MKTGAFCEMCKAEVFHVAKRGAIVDVFGATSCSKNGPNGNHVVAILAITKMREYVRPSGGSA